MTPNLNPNSDAKILQKFLQPIFANPEYENFKFFRDPTIQTPQMLYLFETLTLPFTLNPPHFTLSPYH